MPLSNEPPPEADEAAALVFWLIKHGTASLAKAIERQIRLVHGAVLPWLIRQFQYVLAIFVSPLWQHFTRGLIRLLNCEVAKRCRQMLRAWLSSLSRTTSARKRLAGPPSTETEASLHQSALTKANAEESISEEETRWLEREEQSQAFLKIGELDSAQPNNNAWKTASVSGISGSSSKTDARPEHSSNTGAGDDVLPTLSRREPFLGNWSSGAAWLQSQATSAAAAAAASLRQSDAATTSSGTGALPRSGGRHRRNTPTASSFMLDRDLSSSPLSNNEADAWEQQRPDTGLQPDANRTLLRKQQYISNLRATASSAHAVSDSTSAVVGGPRAAPRSLRAANMQLRALCSSLGIEPGPRTGSPNSRSAEQALEQANTAFEMLKHKVAARQAAKTQATAAVPLAQVVRSVAKQETQLLMKAQDSFSQRIQTQDMPEGTAAIGSLHGAAAAERLSSNNRAEKRPLTDTPTEESAAAGAPNAQGAVTGSPVSSSNSHLGPNSPLSDSAYAPVMWFNGAAADSEHSEGNPAQTSQAECSSSEPRPVAAVSLEPAGTAAADSNHAVEDEGHHPSMLSTSWGDYEQQQQHGCDPLNLQQSCITNDLHMEEQQDQDQAAPNLIQSAESLSAWLGSRTASLDANDAPEALTSIAEADYISDATAVTVQHSLQHATAAAGKECEVSVSTEKHAQDSNQYAAARPSVTAECFSANCEAAKDVDQQAPSGTTSARAVKRYSQLSVSHEASRKNTEPECDIYNLESPGPILIAGQNGALGDSYMLALSRPEATLKAWHPTPCPPLLEGQGLGTFLGPPAQRWAAAVALKDSTNVLPTPDKEFSNSLMSRLPSVEEVDEGTQGLLTMH